MSKIETVKTVTQCTQPQPTAKKILVIEDDEDAAELLQLFLVHQGHDVITANTGADAIDRMNEVVFDHVLMDLTLPDYHGYDLAAELNQIQPKAKLVIVSGNEPDRDTMKHLGVSQSLLKPVSKEDLISVVS